MNTKPSNLDCPAMSHAIIAAGVAEGGPNTSETAVASFFVVSNSTGRRILKGKWDRLFRLINAAAKSPIGETILNVLTCGTPWRIVRREAAIDLDGDGDVDHADAMLATNAADRELGSLMEQLIGIGSRRRLEEFERVLIRAVTARVRRLCDSVDAVLNDGPR